MKGLDLNFQKGFPVAIDELNRLQERDQEIVSALRASFVSQYGNNLSGFIGLSGLTEQAFPGTSEIGVLAGWCFYAGKLLQLETTTKFSDMYNYSQLVVKVERVNESDVLWGDGVVRPTYYRDVLKVELNTGTLNAGEARYTDVCHVNKHNWKSATLAATYVDSLGHSPKYAKTSRNEVVMRGWITANAAPAITVMTLPVGFRPLVNVNLLIANNMNSSSVSVGILATGEVQIYAPTASMSYCLDSIRFYLD